ncbi:MAG: 50S ribosomal protein L20 [Candidatus Roizmanbacteria bacterium]|nr:50S ribosomal protein L20 [Candidatus Roizmanbacteria bacterium]
MTRVKRGTTVKRRHKKILKRTSGFRMTKSRLIQIAKEADLHAGQYAFAGRKNRKRDMRRLWILRISEAIKQKEWSYSRFIKALQDKKIELNRKMLAVLASEYPNVFDRVVEEAKK